MNQILIVAHDPLAEAMRQCALHVFPDCGERVLALDVPPQEAPDVTQQRALQLLQRLPAEGVLILTDVFGATPSNVVQRLLQSVPADVHGMQVRALSGMSLPMLLRATCYAELPLDELVERAMAGAQQGIMAFAYTPVQNQQRDLLHDSARHHHQQ